VLLFRLIFFRATIDVVPEKPETTRIMVDDFLGEFVAKLQGIIKYKTDPEVVRNRLLAMIDGMMNSPVAQQLGIIDNYLNTKNKQRILMTLILEKTDQLPKRRKTFEFFFAAKPLPSASAPQTFSWGTVHDVSKAPWQIQKFLRRQTHVSATLGTGIRGNNIPNENVQRPDTNSYIHPDAYAFLNNKLREDGHEDMIIATDDKMPSVSYLHIDVTKQTVTPVENVLRKSSSKYEKERFDGTKPGPNLIRPEIDLDQAGNVLIEAPILDDYVAHVVRQRSLDAERYLFTDSKEQLLDYIKSGLESWKANMDIADDSFFYGYTSNKDEMTLSAQVHQGVLYEQYGVPTNIKFNEWTNSGHDADVADVITDEKSSLYKIDTEASCHHVIEIRPLAGRGQYETQSKTFNDLPDDMESLSERLLTSNRHQMNLILTKILKKLVVEHAIQTIDELRAYFHGKLMNQAVGQQNFMLGLKYPDRQADNMREVLMPWIFKKYDDGSQVLFDPEKANTGDQVSLFQLKRDKTNILVAISEHGIDRHALKRQLKHNKQSLGINDAFVLIEIYKDTSEPSESAKRFVMTSRTSPIRVFASEQTLEYTQGIKFSPEQEAKMEKESLENDVRSYGKLRPLLLKGMFNTDFIKNMIGPEITKHTLDKLMTHLITNAENQLTMKTSGELALLLKAGIGAVFDVQLEVENLHKLCRY